MDAALVIREAVGLARISLDKALKPHREQAQRMNSAEDAQVINQLEVLQSQLPELKDTVASMLLEITQALEAKLAVRTIHLSGRKRQWADIHDDEDEFCRDDEQATGSASAAAPADVASAADAGTQTQAEAQEEAKEGLKADIRRLLEQMAISAVSPMEDLVLNLRGIFLFNGSPSTFNRIQGTPNAQNHFKTGTLSGVSSTVKKFGRPRRFLMTVRDCNAMLSNIKNEDEHKMSLACQGFLTADKTVLTTMRDEKRLWTVVSGMPKPASLPSELVCLIKGFELHMGWHTCVEAYLLKSHRPPAPSDCGEYAKLWKNFLFWEADRLFTKLYEGGQPRPDNDTWFPPWLRTDEVPQYVPADLPCIVWLCTGKFTDQDLERIRAAASTSGTAASSSGTAASGWEGSGSAGSWEGWSWSDWKASWGRHERGWPN